MKRLLTLLQRETGLAASEAIVVLTLLAILVAGWMGKALAPSPATHNVEATRKVIALLDSLAGAGEQAPSGERRTENGERRTENGERRAENDLPPANSQRPATVGKVQQGTSYRINVNTASSAALQRLPGVGPATAQKIMEERVQRPFTSVDDLLRVKGIGPKKLEKLRPFVTAP
jgi:competence ComEA-like helix-hairpin-helix protein